MNHKTFKKDTNHAEISAWFVGLGYQVIDTFANGNAFPDILVTNGAVTFLVEIKTRYKKLNQNQVEFFKQFRGLAFVARNEKDVKAIHALILGGNENEQRQQWKKFVVSGVSTD